MDNKIRNINIEKDEKGEYSSVKIIFGPHYFVDIRPDPEGKLTFYLGATHHGFCADATQVGGGLEKIIYEIRQNHPDLIID